MTIMTVQNIPGQPFYFCSFVAVTTNCLCIKSLWETIVLHDKNALLNQFQGSLSPRCQHCKSLLLYVYRSHRCQRVELSWILSSLCRRQPAFVDCGFFCGCSHNWNCASLCI